MALDLKDLDKFKKQRFKPLVDSSAPVAPKVMKMPWESFTASPETASDEIQRGTTLPSKGNNDQIKGELGALQRGTKGNNKGEHATVKGEQQRGTKGNNSAEETVPVATNVILIDSERDYDLENTSLHEAKGNNKGEQTGLVPLCDAESSPLSGALFPFEETIKGEQTGLVPLCDAKSSPLQRGTTKGNKGEQIPSSAQQLAILRYVLSVQQSSGLDHTTRLQRKAISEATSIEPESLKTLLKRLRRDGYLVRREARHGRGESGCVFEIPSATALALQRQDRQPKGEQQRGTKGNFKGEQPPPLVSSSDLKTTTTDKQRAERFQNACEKFGLQEIGLGANDLLQIWRRGVFESDDDYLASIEHLAFYLSTADAKGITHPKAWLTSQLAKGFYPAPAGFKSWEERQQEAILAAKRERLAKLEELKRQQLEADFELWIAELSVEAKQRKLAGTPFAEQPASKLARSMLRDVFLRERGEAAD